ncbi:hypothetical protein HJC23_009766 [Cyclotella cryptica]|uniref:Uncharacterized protein n=1 Tax=Cyclotella cryptica TaxID=29204 RepID=A0ABD3PTF4_9STRA|eukprot:CCRYP_012124-RA/>CCRYP_012124-RA protein AED:0.01 eAED:0.00 QI:0/-1/0/1/-1/1/1/0/746
MSALQPGNNTPSSPQNPKEVDYYLNPTELFRWINYRRWDGARARAQSHPDECDTWIVSRHTSDGRILWRHLPLHLVCMQREAATVPNEEDLNATVAARHIETLIDVLLDSYPEGASSPDDQGMLPLHLLLTKCENEPNERVINLLLTSFPNAVDVQDKFGRTPYDILREQSKDGASDRTRAAFRALKRARYVSDRISATIRDESANIVAAVQNEASNERGASQKIIVRLEEELSNCRKQMDEQRHRDNNLQAEIRMLSDQLASAKVSLDNANRALEMTRKERDGLLNKAEDLGNRLKYHDRDLENVRQEAEEKRQNDIDTIANLRSELNTSKAMSEALESQLRSRFTNEEYLSTSVTSLEAQLEELTSQHEHALKKAQHEVESLNVDNKRLKFNAEELSKKNTLLQYKLSELSQQVTSIMSSHSALSSEHDRLIELSERHEALLLDAFRKERSELVDAFSKQRAALEKSFAEQERVVKESLKKEESILRQAKEDRSRGRGMVEKIRKEFQEIRTAAADRERQMHAEALVANRKVKRDPVLINPSSSTSTKHSYGSNPSTPIETRNPLPSQEARSGHAARIPQHHSPSNQVDGHLVRLLDERAASQSSSSRRDPDGTITGSYAAANHRSYYANEGNVDLNTNQIRRDGRNKHLPPTSIPGSMYQTSSYQGGYSLDEYSHASDDGSNSAGYSDSSSYERAHPSRDSHDYQRVGGSRMQTHHNNRHDFGNARGSLQYISESYGDESGMG